MELCLIFYDLPGIGLQLIKFGERTSPCDDCKMRCPTNPFIIHNLIYILYRVPCSAQVSLAGRREGDGLLLRCGINASWRTRPSFLAGEI